MRKVVIGIAAFVGAAAGSMAAATALPARPEHPAAAGPLVSRLLDLAQHHDHHHHWRSLGCVHTADQCHHLAESRGLYTHRVVHSDSCHTHRLCQGR